MRAAVAKQARGLRISSPVLSPQLRSPEDNVGEKLLGRSGRNLVLTEMGRTATLGRELMDKVRNRATGRPCA